MQTIPILLSKPGMVLALAVVNAEHPDSPPICGRGVVLTESLIERLVQMGVQSVTVEGHPVAVEGEPTLAESLEMLDRRFRKVDADPLMLKIKEIYRKLLLERRADSDG